MIIAICDDKKEYRNFLEQHVKLFFNDKSILFECYQFANGNDLIKAEKQFDIIFLDIEMNNTLNGIETARIINQKSKNTIIFIVTAYRKYLDDAMDLNVFRYIDKPVNSKRVYAGLEKALEYIDNNEISFSTREDGYITINKNEIMYVEVSHKKVFVTTVDKQYIAREKMNYFKSHLTASYFIIPHNSYVVNINYIVKFKREKITIRNNYEISIAPKKQSEVKQRFMKFMGEN